jgi:hypothetical protein
MSSVLLAHACPAGHTVHDSVPLLLNPARQLEHVDMLLVVSNELSLDELFGHMEQLEI